MARRHPFRRRRWFGDDFFANLKMLTERLPFWRNLGWSLYVALMSTALMLPFCSMGGCALACFDMRFKSALFAFVMASMLLPSVVNMIPSFRVMDALGWIDQARALDIGGAASAFGLFLMRQFVARAVPRDLIGAARMDGCSELRIPANDTLPLALRNLQSPVDTEWGALMTGSAIATVQLLILLPLSSRQLISRLTAGAVK